MAIRAGTGGLKYPLPIDPQAQQSAAAASAGGSAAASTFGANRQFAATKMRVQADLANAAADRDYRAQSQMQEQGFRAVQNYMDRELGAQQQRYAQDAAAERQQAQFDQQTALQGQSQTFQQEQFEREKYAGIEGAIQTGRLELNPKQQQQLRELDDVGPKELGGFDAEQRAEFEQQREARRREILESARPPQVTAKGQAERSLVHYDPQTKGYVDQPGPNTVAGTVGKDGQFQPIVANPNEAAEEKERQKQQKEQQVADQKRREAEQSLNDEIYKEAKSLVDDGTYTDITAARDAVLEQRRSVGASAPEQAPADPTIAPEAPLPSPAGMAGSLSARSGDSVPLPPGHPNASTASTPGWQGPPGPLGQMPTPMSAQERDALPPGSYYLTPTGEMRRKK